MLGALFFLFVLILTFILQFLMVKAEKLTDERKKGFQIFRPRGKIALFVTILIIVISFLQYRYNEDINEQQKKQLIIEQDFRDSIIKVKVDSSSNSLYEKLSVALKKNDLKLDTANLKLLKLENDTSSKKVVNNFVNQLPVLYVDSLIISRLPSNKYEVKITVSMRENSATNFNVKIRLLGFNNLGNYIKLPGEKNLLPKDYLFGKGSKWTSNINFNSDSVIDGIYLHMIGYYSDLSTQKNISLNIIYKSTHNEKEVRIVHQDFQDSILRAF